MTCRSFISSRSGFLYSYYIILTTKTYMYQVDFWNIVHSGVKIQKYRRTCMYLYLYTYNFTGTIIWFKNISINWSLSITNGWNNLRQLSGKSWCISLTWGHLKSCIKKHIYLEFFITKWSWLLGLYTGICPT